MLKYFLMHKNQECGALILDEHTGRVIEYKDNKNGLSPYLGTSDIRKLQQWWEIRAVPSSRVTMQKAISAAGCFSTEAYLVKNLGLSMTDTYWIKPEGIQLSFDDVKFSNLALFSHGKIPYHNATSYDPNASLGGQMEKYWDLAQEIPILVKESYKHFGQQSINEVFATMLHERQNTNIPFVRYTASITEDRGIECRCAAFTSENVELLSAHEVLESQKTNNEQAEYDKFISICVQNGIDHEVIQNFMDYQTMTDFIISNTDEHLLNFGVLRNADTMDFIGPAPIFDSGNSMFFSDERRVPYTRAGILELPITSFYKTEEKMIKKVKNRKLVNIDLLPTSSEVKELYANAGIPEDKADVISKNYETKLLLFSEFQSGKTISLYHEKKLEKASKSVNAPSNQKFIMLFGLPAAKRAKLANTLFTDSKLKHLKSDELYPINRAVEKFERIFNPAKITNDVVIHPEYKNAIVLISQNEVHQELKNLGFSTYDASLVTAIIDVRIKIAFKSGASVIYDAMNNTKILREKYINLAIENGVQNLELYSVGMISKKSAHTHFVVENPTKSEGWTKIIKCDTTSENSINAANSNTNVAQTKDLNKMTLF